MRPLDAKDLQRYIRHLLLEIKMWTLSGEILILGTAAQESHCGKWLEQMGGGPAVGIYQIEPRTYADVLENVLPVYEKRCGLGKQQFPDNPEFLKFDLRLSTIIARLHYARFKEKLPSPHDLQGLARYYKKYWNTEEGKGTEEEFLENLHRVWEE